MYLELTLKTPSSLTIRIDTRFADKEKLNFKSEIF